MPAVCVRLLPALHNNASASNQITVIPGPPCSQKVVSLWQTHVPPVALLAQRNVPEDWLNHLKELSSNLPLPLVSPHLQLTLN